MALQTQVRLRSRGNPLFRRHGTLCRNGRRGGIKPRAGREKMRRPKNLENIRKWLILVSAPVVFLTVFGVFVALSSVPAASSVYLRRASKPWEGWRSRRFDLL